jgi:hypothetical protein
MAAKGVIATVERVISFTEILAVLLASVAARALNTASSFFTSASWLA